MRNESPRLSFRIPHSGLRSAREAPRMRASRCHGRRAKLGLGNDGVLDCGDPIFCCTKNGQAIRVRPPFGDVAEWLATRARRHPRKPAVIFRHIDNEIRETIDYRRLHDLVWRTAAVLARRAGVVPGDAVAYALPNRPEALILNLAAMWLGARAVPLDLSRDPLDRKRFKLQNASCKVLVVPGQGVEDPRSRDRASELDALCADQLTISLGPHGRTEVDLLACWAESARPRRESAPPATSTRRAACSTRRAPSGNPRARC